MIADPWGGQVLIINRDDMRMMMQLKVTRCVTVIFMALFLSGFSCNRSSVDASLGEAVTTEDEQLHDPGELIELDDAFFGEDDSGELFPEELIPDDVDDFDPYLEADELYERLQRVPPPLPEEE